MVDTHLSKSDMDQTSAGANCGCDESMIVCREFSEALGAKVKPLTSKASRSDALIAALNECIAPRFFIEMDGNGDCWVTAEELDNYQIQQARLLHAAGYDFSNEIKQQENAGLKGSSFESHLVVNKSFEIEELHVLTHIVAYKAFPGRFAPGGCVWFTNAEFDTLWNPDFSRDRCPDLAKAAPLDGVPPPTPQPTPTAVTHKASVKPVAKISVPDLIAQGKALGLDMSEVETPATPVVKPVAPDPIAVVQPDDVTAPTAAVATEPKPVSGVPQMMLTCNTPTRLGEIVARGARIRTTDKTYADYSASYDYSAVGRGGVPTDHALKPKFDQELLERIAALEVQLGQPNLPLAQKEKLRDEQARLVDQTPLLQPGVFFIVGVKK